MEENSDVERVREAWRTVIDTLDVDQLAEAFHRTYPDGVLPAEDLCTRARALTASADTVSLRTTIQVAEAEMRWRGLLA